MTKEAVPKATPAPLDETVEGLRRLLPAAFSEGQISFEGLRAALGEAADAGSERYSFTWAGKQDAIRLLQVPSRATLAACPDESIEFDATGHLFIEGDNLEVLKLLYRPYFGRVKMIYIDPPYNTGNDFIYRDDFADPLARYFELTGQADSAGNLLTSNPETSGRYHSAWLSMMYPRLFLARQLLRDDGIVFVSIDDHEVANLRLLMNEVFGEENFIASVIWQKVYAPKNTAQHFSEDHDYVLVFARNAETWRPLLLPRSEEADARYLNPDNDPRGPWKPGDVLARNFYSRGSYTVVSPSGAEHRNPTGTYWRVSHEKLQALDRDNRIWWGETGSNVPAIKRFLSEVRQGFVPQTLWPYQEVGHTQEAKKDLLARVHFENTENVLNTLKPTRLIRRMLQIATEPDAGDLVLDFFAGSAPTAQAVLEQNAADNGNRRFIVVQFPEPLPTPEPGLRTISDIGKQRIRHVAAEFRAGEVGKLDLSTRTEPEDLGFRVFQLRPSNYRQWAGVAHQDPEAYTGQMEIFNDPLVDGWEPNGVLWEIALKEGFGLSSRVDPLGLATNHVSRVSDVDAGRQLLVCLDDVLAPETLETLGLSKEDLFICRDVALTDELAANLALQCRLKTI